MQCFGTLVKLCAPAWLIFNFLLPYKIDAQTEGGSAALFLQLKKLQVLGRVLYVAAHPDDENSLLLPWLSKEKLYETAYLSLTRGEGGQNLIGDEQGVELGLIRTQELLEARKIDGCEQFFTRAFEFGYCKSANEALAVWGKEKILYDMVWVIRKYRPDVIIARFPPDARAGHGQHAASAILIREAFEAAAAPDKFPDQLQAGVEPWRSKRLLWNAYKFGNINTTNEKQVKIEVGGWNPLLGQHIGEIGAAARAMHKSQGEGIPSKKGTWTEYFENVAGDAMQSSLMDGVDTGWSRIEGGRNIQQLIEKALERFDFKLPLKSIGDVLAIHRAIKKLAPSHWRDRKLADAQALLENLAGTEFEAVTTKQFISQGDSLVVSAKLSARLADGIKIGRVAIWDNKRTDSPIWDTVLAKQSTVLFQKGSLLPIDQPISQPYWLAKPMESMGRFAIEDVKMIGLPENGAAFMLKIEWELKGEPFETTRPIQFKRTDPLNGDVFQPVYVVPAFELECKDRFLLSMNGKSVMTSFRVLKNVGSTTDLPSVSFECSNSQTNASKEFLLERDKTDSTRFDFSMRNVAHGRHAIRFRADKNGLRFDRYRKTIAYPHLKDQVYFPEACINITGVKAKIGPKNIGYFTGTSDKVRDALSKMGYRVSLLGEDDLAANKLKTFAIIVTGPRAYNLHPWLSERYELLMDYVKQGGNLVVQYAKGNATNNGSPIRTGPFSLTVDGLSRITDEAAKVVFKFPHHPLFNRPNKLSEADFEGWTQERSTYQARERSKEYTALLSMKDSMDANNSDGSLLTLPYGKGRFTYVSLAMFRQLPAGVPGAYRIMANILSPKGRKETITH